MYQTIEDIDVEIAETPKSRSGIWPFILGVLSLGTIFTLVFLNSPGPAVNSANIRSDEAATEAYRKAISEPNPALRRARLNDYLLTIENPPHEKAVIAQIDVINQYELEDWERLQNVVYGYRSDKAQKITALEAYESKWGAPVLGARNEDLVGLRAQILGEVENEDLPERRFTGGPSPIPQTIPDTELAGGPRPIITFMPTNRPNMSSGGNPFAPVETTPLRIRRDVEPRYPRNALRRDVEALVTLKLNIDEDGRVAMTELVSIEADRYERDFVKAAERAAMRSRYHPRIENGRPIAVSGVEKRYRFTIEN